MSYDTNGGRILNSVMYNCPNCGYMEEFDPKVMKNNPKCPHCGHDMNQTSIDYMLYSMFNDDQKVSEKRKHGLKLTKEEIKSRRMVASIWIAAALILIIGFGYVILSNIGDSARPNARRCDYCGGQYICSVCGKEGVYCERSSWGGSSKDHFCAKHWADCCEWHEKQNRK